MTSSDFYAQFRRIQAEIDALPPCPSVIFTSHSVPWGRVYRQWTSRGYLVVWVNRGEFEDMPRRTAAEIAQIFDLHLDQICPPAISGIPVRHR